MQTDVTAANLPVVYIADNSGVLSDMFREQRTHTRHGGGDSCLPKVRGRDSS